MAQLQSFGCLFVAGQGMRNATGQMQIAAMGGGQQGVSMHLDSFPPPATRLPSIAPRLRSVLDRLGQRKVAAGSVRYDDNCRGVVGPSIRRVPVRYSCVTPRTGGVLPQ